MKIKQVIRSVIPVDHRRMLKRIVYRLSPLSYDYAIDDSLQGLIRKISLWFSLFPGKEKQFINEISFIRQRSDLSNPVTVVFPYPFVFDYDPGQIAVAKDEENGLFYVNQGGKRLYYSRDYTNPEEIKVIYNALLIEQDRRSPHRYLADEINVNDDDVVIDVGAAEGNLSLEVIERVKELYIFEADKKWIEALNATFEPWKDKVHIINKYVSGTGSDGSVTLDSMFSGSRIDFIKIDADGAEPVILMGARKIMKSTGHLKMAICTYHRKHDARKIQKILLENNFDYSFSDGYMLFMHNRLTPPFFRRGLIRARKRLTE